MSGHHALDFPEDYLWIDLGSGKSTVLGRRRLVQLRYGADPKSPTEELLAANPDWLRIYLDHLLGDYVMTIPERGPLPEWREEFLMAMEGPGASDESIARRLGGKSPDKANAAVTDSFLWCGGIGSA